MEPTATTYPGFATNTIGASTTVNYASSSAQTIAAVNYGYITNSGNGNRTLPSSGTIGIANTFTPGVGTYTVTGQDGFFQWIECAIDTGVTFNNLTISTTGGNATVSAAITLTGNLVINSSSTLDMAGYSTSSFGRFERQRWNNSMVGR